MLLAAYSSICEKPTLARRDLFCPSFISRDWEQGIRPHPKFQKSSFCQPETASTQGAHLSQHWGFVPTWVCPNLGLFDFETHQMREGWICPTRTNCLFFCFPVNRPKVLRHSKEGEHTCWKKSSTPLRAGPAASSLSDFTSAVAPPPASLGCFRELEPEERHAGLWTEPCVVAETKAQFCAVWNGSSEIWCLTQTLRCDHRL